jgi:glutathione peroxidase
MPARATVPASSPAQGTVMTTAYDFDAQDLDGKDVSLGRFRGKALLVVNVASKCGFTPQYTGLEAVYRRHKDEGLEVLCFPCDQFGHQVPVDAEEF